jgi:hypothetical protein
LRTYDDVKYFYAKDAPLECKHTCKVDVRIAADRNARLMGMPD